MLLAELVESYTVRHAFLAELQAAMVVKHLAKAMGNQAGTNEEVSASEMFGMMGIEIGDQTS